MGKSILNVSIDDELYKKIFENTEDVRGSKSKRTEQLLRYGYFVERLTQTYYYRLPNHTVLAPRTTPETPTMTVLQPYYTMGDFSKFLKIFMTDFCKHL